MAPHRSVSRRFVLDANAVIGFFEGRQPVADRVHKMFIEAVRSEAPLWMSAINWGEVYYTEWRHFGEATAQDVERKFRSLPIVVMPVDHDRATRAAAIKQKHNLGYADSFAAELAIERRAWLVTSDPEFAMLGRVLSVYGLPRHEKS